MFGKKRPADIQAFLGKGSALDGNLTFHGPIRIDGNVAGRITGDGVLVLGEGARVEADIQAPAVRISGTVVGSIDAPESIHITSTGCLRGDIRTAVLVCEAGGFFAGNCDMQRTEDGPTKKG